MSHLRALTLKYWQLSQSYRGRGGSVTVERAFQEINELTSNLGPQRRVVGKVIELQQRIIKGGRNKKGTLKAQVLPLQRVRNQ